MDIRNMPGMSGDEDEHPARRRAVETVSSEDEELEGWNVHTE
jgi:hypothetical protein